MTRGLGGQSPTNITHHLKGAEFPASRGDLEKQAKDKGAEDDVLGIIRQMPDKDYEIWRMLPKGLARLSNRGYRV